MKRTHKPVRECRDCSLNLADRCGVYEWPHDQWHQQTCSGYMNEELAREFFDEQAKHPPDERKLKRRKTAVQRHTEPHHQGARDPARR